MSGAAELDKEFNYGQNRYNPLGSGQRCQRTIRLVPKKEGESKTPGLTSGSKPVQMSSRLIRLQKRWADAVAAADVVAVAGGAGTARVDPV